MSSVLASSVFVVAALVTLTAASLFADRLDRLGVRLGLTEAVLGVLTALAADLPEITSAVTAMLRGEHSVGVGVVVGSNAFNLAAMIGGGALIAGQVRPRRASLWFEATLAVPATIAAGAVIAGAVDARVALLVVSTVLVPYVALLCLGDQRVHLVPLPAKAHAALRLVLGEGLSPHRPGHAHAPMGRTLAALSVGLLLMVGGSIVLVDSALVVADDMGISRAMIGLVVLAVPTSLPNAVTAIRLARMRRGDAVVSETMNSNTINLVAGILLPAAILGSSVMRGDTASVLWMVGLTGCALALLAAPNGIRRGGGLLLVAVYVAFLVTSTR